MKYLLDTNILVYAYQNRGGVRQRLEAHDANRVHVCAINAFEIERGIAKSARPQALRLFLSDTLTRYVQAPLDTAAAQRAGQLRAALERQGQPIGPYDLLIAGIALAHGLTLVTHNTAEFARVPGLQLDDWYTETPHAPANQPPTTHQLAALGSQAPEIELAPRRQP